jgi:hypothetical protein
MIVSEEVMDGQVKDFAPHMLVRNDSDEAFPEGLLGSAGQRGRKLLLDRGREHGGPASARGRGRGTGLGLEPGLASSGRPVGLRDLLYGDPLPEERLP